MPDAAWSEVRPGYWRRTLSDGSWLGVKPDGARWTWVHVMGEGRWSGATSAQCWGLSSVEAAQVHADDYAGN